MKKRPVQTLIQRGFLAPGALQSHVGINGSLHQPQVKGTGCAAPARRCEAGAVVCRESGGRGDERVEFADPVLRCFG